MNESCCKVTFQCEDIKTVAQLIEAKDDLVTVDMKKRYAARGETSPGFCLQKMVTLLVFYLCSIVFFHPHNQTRKG